MRYKQETPEALIKDGKTIESTDQWCQDSILENKAQRSTIKDGTTLNDRSTV